MVQVLNGLSKYMKIAAGLHNTFSRVLGGSADIKTLYIGRKGEIK